MNRNLFKLTVILALIKRRKNKKRVRQYSIHPINRIRDLQGEHLKLDKLKNEFPLKFFQYTRLKPKQFDYLLNLISHLTTRQLTNYRAPIDPRIRLYVTLRYLATGDSLKTIALNYCMGVTTVWQIIRETCIIIWDVLKPIFLKSPDCETWKYNSYYYNEKWNFPHCVGALDGKHCLIQAPKNSGSIYFNYKKEFSIVLLALIDPEYRFTVVDIGAYGKQSDGGIFSSSILGQRLENGSLEFPQPDSIPNSNSNIEIPYFIVGDEAFPLNDYLLRPYPGKFLYKVKRVFNYRLSRARRVSENAFGIMASRFRVFRRPIIAAPHHVENIIKVVVLHNFLRTEELNIEPNKRVYCPIGYPDDGLERNGNWRSEGTTSGLVNIERAGKNNFKRNACDLRDEMARYFSEEGSVPWQDIALGY